MDGEPIKFSCTVRVDREHAVSGDIVVKARIINQQEVHLEGTISGDVGRRLRVERAKRQAKRGRPGYPKPRGD